MQTVSLKGDTVIRLVAGNASTSRFLLASQPLISVYVMVTLPALIAVTLPAETVAILISEDLQGLERAAVPLAVKSVVVDAQSEVTVPVISGNTFTVTVTAVLDTDTQAASLVTST